MGTREGAVARALEFFDGGGFRDRLADWWRSPALTRPGHEGDVRHYLEGAIRPGWSAWVHSDRPP